MGVNSRVDPANKNEKDRIQFTLLDLVQDAVGEVEDEVKSVTEEVMSQEGAGQDFERDLEVRQRLIHGV